MATKKKKLNEDVRKQIISLTEDALPKALEGFNIHTSKSLVKKHKELVEYLTEMFMDELEDSGIGYEEIRLVILDTVDDWEF